MSRINSILSTSLFIDQNSRNSLKKFIETKLDVILTKDRTYHSYFNITNFTLKDEVYEAIRESKMFINFEHDASDRTLQKMIFLFLFYSVEQFPDQASWISFYNEEEDTRISTIREGIISNWICFQEAMLNHELDNNHDLW
jgi:hypothetical protein